MENALTSRFHLVPAGDLPDFHRDVAPILAASWPEFLRHEPIALQHWHDLTERFLDFQFAVQNVRTRQLVAVCNAVPLRWDGPLDQLPEEGWDWAFRQAVEDRDRGRTPNALSLVQMAIHPWERGRGLSPRILVCLRSLARAHGFSQLVVPMRPTLKCLHPRIGLEEYLDWKTPDGRPFDPWLRIHLRLGAKVHRICPSSMRIAAPVHDWEAWTGLHFIRNGQQLVPGALATVNVSSGVGAYVEPNVWVSHPVN